MSAINKVRGGDLLSLFLSNGQRGESKFKGTAEKHSIASLKRPECAFLWHFHGKLRRNHLHCRGSKKTSQTQTPVITEIYKNLLLGTAAGRVNDP